MTRIRAPRKLVSTRTPTDRPSRRRVVAPSSSPSSSSHARNLGNRRRALARAPARARACACAKERKKENDARKCDESPRRRRRRRPRRRRPRRARTNRESRANRAKKRATTTRSRKSDREIAVAFSRSTASPNVREKAQHRVCGPCAREKADEESPMFVYFSRTFGADVERSETCDERFLHDSADDSNSAWRRTRARVKRRAKRTKRRVDDRASFGILHKRIMC